MIDGGIHAASWSPDYSCLAILTGNNTMLLMSNTWEPISEIDFPAFDPQSPVGLSWKGDGELLSVVSQDASDNTYHARIYNKSLQLYATGRNVADGPAAILKGLGGCTAFAPNGTLVAVYQRRAAELPQVAFLEKNGLRHGDFDLRKPPPVPSDIQVGDWDVKQLSWDMTSTVIAVSWSTSIVSSTSPSMPSAGAWGCVQLYYRENYYWYLKQQWTGLDLAFLTFDNEVQGRLYMRQTATVGAEQRGLVSFVLGNARGRITRGGYLRIPNPHRAALREITILPLQASDETLKSGGGGGGSVKLAVVAVGSLAYRVDAEHADALAKDLLFVVHLDEASLCQSSRQPTDAVAFTHHYVLDNLPGTIYALSSIVGETHALAVGMKDHETANFDVYRLDFAHAYADLATEESLPANATIDYAAFPQEHLLVIPEICPQFYVVVNPTAAPAATAATAATADHAATVAMPSSYYSHTVISLSLKNRLYVGEVLLVPGASSFAFNHAYNMLLFITVGTKPMLHFRIDLNYLVDFDPTIFFAALAQWIPEALQKKADLLSLFITSLDAVDVTTTKYVLFDETSLENRQRRRAFVEQERFVGDEKINVVCRRMREELLRYLATMQATTPTATAAASAASAQQQTTVLNAVLCTYAKQRPPLLVDALHFIQAQQQRAIAAAATAGGGTRLVQVAAIKYLVFLVDGAQLFDAAVGDCVFDLARAVARQCQMDPKVYLPLLETFESIGRGYAAGSLPQLLMHLHVQHHLARVWATVDDFVRLLSQWYEAEAESDSEASLVTIEQLLPALVALEVRMEDDLSSSSSTKASVAVTRQFLTATRALYAQQCLQQMQYTPAIHAFLTCYPPMGSRAVDAAMAAGDWKQALSLANRFASATLSPLKIVQDIVSNFKQNQDDSATFASAMDVAAITVTQTIGAAVTENRSLAVQAAISATTTTATAAGQQVESKAIEAAAFCVEYLNDVESAVTILTTAQHWTAAMDYAGRLHRRDLYDEIYAALRLAVEDTIATLEERTASFPQAARILKELWTLPSATATASATVAAAEGDEDDAAAGAAPANAPPLDRLHQVAQHDRMLQRILERLEQGDDYDDAVQPSSTNGAGGDSASVINDNASDFSAASKYSLLSLRSARSTQSGVSVQSAQSRSSQYSL
eukprot:gene9081-6530_t